MFVLGVLVMGLLGPLLARVTQRVNLVLLHLVALFRFYIQTVADRPFDGDGKVSLVRAVIMAPAPTADTIPAGSCPGMKGNFTFVRMPRMAL